MENDDFFLVLAAVSLTWFRLRILTSLLKVGFRRHLRWLSGLSHVCAIQWPVWDEGSALYHSPVFKVDCILFSVRVTHAQEWAQQFINISMGSFPSSSLAMIVSVPFTFGGLPLLVLWPESWGFIYAALWRTSCDSLYIRARWSG